MSQLSELLNTAQLTKYYELLQFLSSHTNVEYTLAQLDYLLPRGASLQRFPASWIEFMEKGLCSNQNVEVCRRPFEVGRATGDGVTLVNAPGREEVVLICRRPEVADLESLAKMLQSPATVPDVEGCVALHTEQITIQESLVRASQIQGLLYYFPDSYPKLRDSRPSRGRHHSNQREVLGTFMRGEDLEGPANEATNGGELDLPADVTVQFVLYNRRGVPLRGWNSFPMRFNTGERAMVVVERNTSLNAISLSCKAPVVTVSLGRPAGVSGSGGEAIAPVDIRVKMSASSTSNQRTYMIVKAQAKGKVILSLFVEGRETIVPLEVVDENTGMPGVMIGREQQPPFPLPDDICINDPAIWGGCGDCEQLRGSEFSPYDGGGGNGRISVLPWWLNPSPSILEVRDLTMPDSEAFAAASGEVWTVHRADESAMKAVRKALREQYNTEAARKKRSKRERPRDLRNSHMIHYGFDASVPLRGRDHF